MSDPHTPNGADQPGAVPEGAVPPPPPYVAPPAAPLAGNGPSYDAAAPPAPYGQPVAPAAPYAAPGQAYGAPANPYAPPAYPGAAPGYPPVGQPPYYPQQGTGTLPPADRPKKLAFIALGLAIGGFVLAWIPFVTWFAGFILLAAVIVAIIALAGKKYGGKGISIGAIVVSVVGWLVSLAMGIFSIGLLGQLAYQESVRDSTGGSSWTDVPGDDTTTDDGAAVAGDVQDLEVVETTFGRTDYDDGVWWYVVIVNNPNTDYVFDFATVDVEALDTAGTILDSSSAYATLLSGETALTGTLFEVGDGAITELQVLTPATSEAMSAPADETGSLTVSELEVSTDDFSTAVRGTISGTFDTEQEYVTATVIARDESGEIVATQIGYVERLPVDGAAQFEATFFDPLPEGTTFEAYPSL